MNILATVELEELRDTLRRALLGELPRADVHERNRRVPVWSLLTEELGLLEALADPDVIADAGAVKMMTIVAEELGRVLAGAEFIPTLLAMRALEGAGDQSLAATLVRVRSGAAVGTVALGGAADWSGLQAPVADADGRVTGEHRLVMEAEGSDFIVTLAMRGGAPSLWSIDRDSIGVDVVSVPVLDTTRSFADCRFENAQGVLIAEGSACIELVDELRDLGAQLLAAEALGGARACFETTLEYVKTRHQFGRPIGSFQAVKHRLADRFADIEAAAALVALAAAVADDDEPVAKAERRPLSSAAKVGATEMFRHVADDCVQLHGAIGYTWEHQAHLFFKRAITDSLVWGTAQDHRSLIARACEF